jgi:hypothetical protein
MQSNSVMEVSIMFKRLVSRWPAAALLLAALGALIALAGPAMAQDGTLFLVVAPVS